MDTTSQMARLKWKWAKHNERKTDNRWNNTVNKWHYGWASEKRNTKIMLE